MAISVKERRVLRAAIRLARRIEEAQWDEWLEATSLVNVVNDLVDTYGGNCRMTQAERYTRAVYDAENKKPRPPKFYGDRVPWAGAKASVTPEGFLVVGDELFAPTEAIELSEFIWAWFRPNGADPKGDGTEWNIR